MIKNNFHKLILRWMYNREERDGVFPFVYNVQFKLAIAFARHEFKFAVNGIPFETFRYRSRNQLNCLNGMKVVGSYGMHVEVTSVEYVQTETHECHGYEMFSHPDKSCIL